MCICLKKRIYNNCAIVDGEFGKEVTEQGSGENSASGWCIYRKKHSSVLNIYIFI